MFVRLDFDGPSRFARALEGLVVRLTNGDDVGKRKQGSEGLCRLLSITWPAALLAVTHTGRGALQDLPPTLKIIPIRVAQVVNPAAAYFC